MQERNAVDADVVLEVPNAPDRMTIIHPVDESSACSFGREDVMEEFNTSFSEKDTEGQLRQARLPQFIPKSLETNHLPGPQDALLQLKQNIVSHESEGIMKSYELSEKHPLSHVYPTLSKGPRRKKETEKSGESVGSESLFLPSKLIRKPLGGNGDLFDGGDVGLNSIYKGKGIVETKEAVLKPLWPDEARRSVGQRRPVSNSSISSCKITKSHNPCEVDGQSIINSVTGERSSLSWDISGQDNMKGIDLYKQLQLDAPPGNAGRRRLVGNEVLDAVSSRQGNIIGPDFEGSHADKKKGKVVFYDNAASNSQDIKANPRLDRVCSITGKEVTIIADDDDGALRSSEDINRRAKHDSSIFLLREGASVSKRGNNSSHLHNRRHGFAVGDREYVKPVHDSPEVTASHHRSESRRRQRWQKATKGKRKGNTGHSNYDECSSSVLEDADISYFQSSGCRSNSKLTSTFDCEYDETTSGPVIDVDELYSPEVGGINPQEHSCRVSDESSARAIQVESDEMLARQLQEQFYYELPEFGGTEETDATIAWSLQKEDARRSASIARRGQVNPRDASIAHLYAQYPRLPLQNSSGGSTNIARVPTSSRMAQLRRNNNSTAMDLETRMMADVRRNFNSAEMDLEMRVNLFETLVAAFDHSNDMFAENVLQIPGDFNEDDYEMLLALDENSCQHGGASESWINRLPQSVIQSDAIQEACAVCLEPPSVGDSIRHLPCLHKFHKECIDTWLRMRTTCPVCKSHIT